MTCGLSFGERRARLQAAHGPATSVPDTAAALRLIGRRRDIHPDDAAAFAYRDQAAADAYAASNAAHQHVVSLGTAITEGGGVIAVLDLRPALAWHARQAGRSWTFTDPDLPDRWVPGRPGRVVSPRSAPQTPAPTRPCPPHEGGPRRDRR